MNQEPSGTLTDDALLRVACEQPDERLLEQVYTRFGNRMLKVAMSVAQNREDAEEAVQDAFLAIWRGSARFDGRSKAYTWLYRVTINKTLERARKRKSRSSWLFWAKGEPEQQPVDHNTPFTGIEEREQRAEANALLNRLPEKQRVAFNLFYFSELPYQDVAHTMNTTISSVESLLFRARKNLEKFIVQKSRQHKTNIVENEKTHKR
ncbi:MAG: RNA polymerase sigma factor [Flammeovirgaceae bacterium]